MSLQTKFLIESFLLESIFVCFGENRKLKEIIEEKYEKSRSGLTFYHLKRFHEKVLSTTLFPYIIMHRMSQIIDLHEEICSSIKDQNVVTFLNVS